MTDQPIQGSHRITVIKGVWCRVCGTEKDGDNVIYRDRSRLFLCDSCHEDTPEKATVEEFCQVTGLDRNARGFENWWEDYKYSSYGDVAEYWAACSS